MAVKKKAKVEFTINVPISFKWDEEVEAYIASCPPLDVWSQGDTKKEAEHNIKEAVSLFLVSCLERGTIGQVLKGCGWTPVSTKAKSKAKRVKSTPDEKNVNIPIPMELASC